MAGQENRRATEVRQCKAARTGALTSILCALILLSTGTACAADPNPQAFNIAPQGLASALTAFARQSQQEILFSPELIARKSSSGVRGTMPPLAALKILLDGSGLSVTSTRNGAILIGNLSSASDSSSNTEAGTPVALTEVIVSAQSEAQRAQLAARIAAYVNEVTAVAADDDGLGLAEWREPVCPLVSGLSEDRGEFILARISEIAHAANVPLAGEHCTPNLYVYVTPRPRELLQGMEKRAFAFTFGVDAFPTVVDRFIETPRAVRAWYIINRENGSGAGTAQPFMLGSILYAFERIIVVVDQRRLRAVSLGQIADYIGLVGLAQLRQGTHLDGAPTILSLFNVTQQAAPASMSDWDRAFLKSLYGTDVPTFYPLELRSKVQLSQITRRMVREIAP
jgi:hypothetical protein